MTSPNDAGRRPLGLDMGAGQALRILTASPCEPGGAALAGVDFIVFRDTIGDDGSEDHYALLVASFAAGRIHGIGLVPEVDLYRADPYLIARALTSLDILSGGRAGLLALGEPRGAADIGYDRSDRSAALLSEFVDVVGKLWNSWGEGALARRWSENLYLDRAKLRETNHKGEYFAVRGPLPTPRAVQARPVIFATDYPTHAGIVDRATAIVSPSGPARGQWAQQVNAAKFAAGRASPEAHAHLVRVPAGVTTWIELQAFVAGLGAGRDAPAARLGDLFSGDGAVRSRELEENHG